MKPGESGDGNAPASGECCDQCGNDEATLGKYADGTLCPGCRVALGPEPEEGHYEP
jgi:hypothetical protein